MAPWFNYFAFCNEVAKKLRSILPHTKFGVTWTLKGVYEYSELWKACMQDMDCAFFTYYPDAGGGRVPSYVNELPELLQLATTLGGIKPIVIQEIGMPSDPKVGGSEQAQAQFVELRLEAVGHAGNSHPISVVVFALRLVL